MIPPRLKSIALLLLAIIACGSVKASAAPAAEIDSASRAALRDLYATNAKARAVGQHAAAILVFPGITKGGFLVAVQHGEGALLTPNGTAGYYNSVAGSYGFQAGVQKYGYALFFMNRGALAHLHDQGGWELASAPSLVIVDKGISKSLNTTQLKDGIYAFFFNQKGLMGGTGIQGAKISEIHPR